MRTLKPAERVIVALDIDDVSRAAGIISKLAPLGVSFKIGLEFIYAMFHQIFFVDSFEKTVGNLLAIYRIFQIRDQIFWDCKLKDIPNTVMGASRVITKMRVRMFNIHCLGGRKMMEAAAQAAKEGGENQPLVLGVTVLTSLDYEALVEMGVFPRLEADLTDPPGTQEEVALIMKEKMEELVTRLAGLANDSGLDGVVCSVKETAAIRKACGPDFFIVNPGIRWEDREDDQKRTDSPFNAIQAGADMLVIGRPITKADDPVAATQFAISEVERALTA